MNICYEILVLVAVIINACFYLSSQDVIILWSKMLLYCSYILAHTDNIHTGVYCTCIINYAWVPAVALLNKGIQDHQEDDLVLLEDDLGHQEDILVLLEDDLVLLEDDLVLLEDDLALLEDDHVLLEDDHVLLEDDHVLLEEDHVLLEEDLVPPEGIHVLPEDIQDGLIHQESVPVLQNHNLVHQDHDPVHPEFTNVLHHQKGLLH